MLRVSSEVGRLRRVLLHEPGPEVDQMVPSMMEELLFDDILFGDRAREEHRRFRRVLQLLGVETLDAEDLLADVLGQPEARRYVLDRLEPAASSPLEEADAAVLARRLLTGTRVAGAQPGVDADDLFEMLPAPNWCFQRDSQVVLGDGVIFGGMATHARLREALLSRAVFRFHPELAGAPVLLDPLEPQGERNGFTGHHRAYLEGGDVLVLSPDVVAVGLSERTNRAGVLALQRALRGRAEGPRWLLVVELPRRRAYMHLDTVFTPVDHGTALVFPPVVLAGGLETAHVHEYDLHAADDAGQVAPDLLTALARRGLDLEPVPCGGPDPVAQQREQWTDGANTLAIAPGLITLYDRNTGTADELARRGFRVVHADDLLLGREEIDVVEPGRCVILLSSHELSRARGGPHCLSHPLVRD